MGEDVAKRGERYFRAGKVLWVIKSGDVLHGKVLGTYPYYVRINLLTGENLCTCPLGGDCKHVHAVLKAYESGMYFEDGSPLASVNPEALAWEFLREVPELAVEVALKELLNSLGRDESGSETAMLFLRTAELIRESGRVEFVHPLEEALEEFSKVFEDYPLIEKLERELESLKSSLKKPYKRPNW